MTTSETTFALAGYAIVAFAVVAVLGTYVSPRTPTRLDVEAIALRGFGVPFAIWFTRLGYWPTLTVVSVLTVALAFEERQAEWLPAALVASHSLSQTVIAAVKPFFHRARPDYWLVKHEVDTSFPSGHAATAMTFYLGLAVLVWHFRIPETTRIVASALLGVCVAGIPWSRLVLGAHYLTDVLGGTLFGSAWLAVSIALVLRYGA